MSKIKRTMAWILGIVLCHHAMAFFLQRQILFPGTSISPAAVPIPDGTLRLEPAGNPEGAHAFLMPPLGKTHGSSPLLVYAHGNAEFAEWNFDLVEPYRRAGFHVLIPEYRGFGQAGGSPTMEAILADVTGHIEQAKLRPDVDGTHVVYHGRSLGGGVLGTVAGRLLPDRLILEASFSSVASMARGFAVPSYLIRDNFSPAAALGGPYTGPVLILHSQDDEVIPFRESSRNLAAATGNPRRTPSTPATRIEGPSGSGHNDSCLLRSTEDVLSFALGR